MMAFWRRKIRTEEEEYEEEPEYSHPSFEYEEEPFHHPSEFHHHPSFHYDSPINDSPHNEENSDLEMHALEDYEKALQEGEVPVTYGRVTIVGQAAVGKTSLKHGLMNERLPKVTESTIVADVQNIKSYGWAKAGSSCDSVWEKVTDEDEKAEVAQMMKRSIKLQQPPSHHNKPHPVDESSLVEAKSIFQPESPIQSPLVDEQEMKKIRSQEVKQVFEEALEYVPQVSAKEDKPEVWLHVWDFGGQPAFLDVLPAFLTSFTMFLLVFDASENLKKKWKVLQYIKGKRSISDSTEIRAIDLLQQWMAAIFCHVAKLDHYGRLLEFPRILPIGTHGDKANREVTKKKWDSYCDEKEYSRILLPVMVVDNTKAGKGKKEDPNFAVIRREIHKLTSERLKVKTPMTWVLFRKVLKRLRETIMSLTEVYEVAVACHIPKGAVPSVLAFYHELGVLLYYSHIESLQDIVIVDPEWLVKQLGKLLILDREVHSMKYLWSKLFKKGIVTESLYKEVWKDCGIRPDALMDLLVKFHLVVEVPSKHRHDQDKPEKEYFLPSMLPYYQGDASILELKSIDHAASLFITFGDLSCVPPGFFVRLVTSLASFKQQSSCCEIDFRKSVYHNRITFTCQQSKSDAIVLTELPGAIQVDLARRDSHPKSFWTVCQELLPSLNACCEKVAEVLSTNQKNIVFGKGLQPAIVLKWEFALLCQNPECPSHHPHYCYFTQDDECLLCSEHGTRQTLPRQKYWLSSKSWQSTVEESPNSSSQSSPYLIAASYEACDQIPEEWDLAYRISPKVAHQWKLIGVLLKIPSGVLDSIRIDHSTSVHDALLAVFATWRRNGDPPFIWRTILEVLASDVIGHQRLADRIALNLKRPFNDDEPEMSNLMNWISPKAAARWRMIGVMLKVSSGSLDAIENDHGRSSTDALLAVFTAWQKTSCSPFTWKTILGVLESDLVDRKDIADDITQKLSNAK